MTTPEHGSTNDNKHIEEALPRLLAIATRRYSREPATRRKSAEHILSSAIRIMAFESTPGEAALFAAEILALIAEDQRRQGLAK